MTRRKLIGSIATLACGTGIVFYAYQISVEYQMNTTQNYNKNEMIEALNKLPTLQTAQQSKVNHTANFLSKSEIEELLTFVEDNQFDFGHTQRDKYGIKKYNNDREAPWSTLFLHTNHKIQQTKPALLKKIIAHAYNVDKAENWNLLPTQRFCMNCNNNMITGHDHIINKDYKL